MSDVKAESKENENTASNDPVDQEVSKTDNTSDDQEASRTEAPKNPNDQSQEPQTKASQPEAKTISKDDYEAVKTNLSTKSKKLSELEKEVETLKNRDQVKELLLEAEYPDEIKAELRSQLNMLTPETFKSEGDRLQNIFNMGVEASKQKQVDFINKKPERIESKDLADKMGEAKTIDELNEIIKEARS